MRPKELIIPFIIAFLGFILNSKSMYLYLNTLTPFEGLVFYYILLSFIFGVMTYLNVISKGGLVPRLEKGLIGSLLIFFSFAIVVNFTNPLVQYYTKGNLNGASQVFYQSEDGVTVSAILSLTNNIELTRMISFVLIPFILSFVGVSIIRGKIGNFII